MLQVNQITGFNIVAEEVSGGNDAYTVLLLHFDGADASTTFTDSSASAHTITPAAQAQIDSAQSKFGGTSMRVDGTLDRIQVATSANFDMGTGDFTVDFWIRFNSSIRQYIWELGSENTAAFVVTPSSGLIEVYGAPGSFVITAGSTVFSTATWYHIALVRNGNAWTVYRDGTSYVSNASDSRAWGSSAFPAQVGSSGGGNVVTNGWIDEFRISKGIARWTANFTPPAVEYS
jgi:hypothetical protein